MTHPHEASDEADPAEFAVPVQAFTWVASVARHSIVKPDVVAVRSGERSLTWAQLDDRSRRAATSLAEEGVGQGDRVVVLMTNRLEFVETVIAVARIGAVVVPVNFRLAAPEVQHILDDSGASAVVTETSLSGLLNGWSGVRFDVDTARYTSALRTYPHSSDGPERIADLAAILYTAGTTGSPKGAMFLHGAFLAQAYVDLYTNGYSGVDDVLLITPLTAHVYAFAQVTSSLMHGHTIVLLPSRVFSARELLEVLEAERVTHCYLTPVLWRQVCADPTVSSRDLRLRRITWGGDMVTSRFVSGIKQCFPGVSVSCVFGLTEMAAVATWLHAEAMGSPTPSLGRPVPLVTARVVNPRLEDAPAGQVGEIVFRGPTCMIGYWNNPAATADALDGGWLHTGDLGYFDEKGFLYFVDRVKDVIVSGNEPIFSGEVEAAIAGLPSVSDVAVIGRPHPTWGQTPVAYVVPADPAAPPTLEDVQNRCREVLASYKKPTELVVIDHLPRNSMAKVLKSRLRDSADHGGAIAADEFAGGGTA